VSGDGEAVVAGHICLDIIPTFEARDKGLESLLSPGRLVEVGPAVTSTGGAVSNTGLALNRLGIRTKLLGKVGEDLFGTAILDIIRRHNDALGKGIVVSPGESSSYTVVISPPGMDRMFLHCPGTNDTFGLDDVDMDQLEGVQLFHFGYPPVMRRMYEDEGGELATLMERVKAHGLTTSLDMTYPDPDSEAGRVNWVAWLERVLPHVDIFLPSLDEILFMLDRHHHDTLSKTTTGELASVVDTSLMSTLASRLLTMGVYHRRFPGRPAERRPHRNCHDQRGSGRRIQCGTSRRYQRRAGLGYGTGPSQGRVAAGPSDTLSEGLATGHRERDLVWPQRQKR